MSGLTVDQVMSALGEASGWQFSADRGGMLQRAFTFADFTQAFAFMTQVVLDLLVGQTNVLQAVEAHEGSRVAIQTVVDKQLGAVLQGCHIVGLVGRLVPGRSAGIGLHTHGQAQRQRQAQNDFVSETHGFHDVLSVQCAAKTTRSGTGLDTPMRLHQGIVMKKPK